MKREYMNMKLFIALAVAVFASLAFADDDAVIKYKNYTPEQINGLPEKERDNSVPMMYILAARRGLSVDAQLLFGMELNALMYPGLYSYNKAVKEFQKDLGDRPTGILTVWQIHNLQQRSEMQKLSTLGFPDQYSSFKTKEFAKVQGTMMLHDERIAWPVNHINLFCYKLGEYCELSQIYLIFPKEDSWSQTFQVAEKPAELYKIINWTENTIDAVPSDPGNGCRTAELNLNFKTKEFFQITRNGATKCDVLGVTLPRLTKPRIAQIVDGKTIMESEFNSLAKKAYNVLASSFRKKVDAVLSK